MSYIGKYFSPRMFYFRASDEAHEQRSSALSTQAASRNLVSELCYRYDLKILGITDKSVSLCTPAGLVPMRVTRHPDEYIINSPYIQKERGDNRNMRSYKALRPLMSAIKDEIPNKIDEADLFQKLYKPSVMGHASQIREWFDREDTRNVTNLIKTNRRDPIMTVAESMEVVEAIFENKLGQIKEHAKYQDMYNKIRLHHAGVVMRDQLLKKMENGSTYVVMQTTGSSVVADLKLKWDGCTEVYKINEVKNIRRVRSLEEIPDVAANYAMLKTAYPEKINNDDTYRWSNFYFDFETSTYIYTSSSNIRPEESRAIRSLRSLLMITGDKNESV